MQTLELGRPMYIGGAWVEREAVIEVRDPQDDSLITTVPAASADDVTWAVHEAREGARVAAAMPAHERMAVLAKAADLIELRTEDYARTLARESSKTLREARVEVGRCVQTLRISAEEARRVHGETIAFDQKPGSEDRVGYYYRFPVGIIAAITPFNDPLNLVAHKVGPAIASGNAVIVKPASVTPLSALLLAQALIEAGLPPKVLSVITGHARDVGDRLVTHPAVRMISFTGGVQAGRDIVQKAGLKKISMELGSSSPVIVLGDADLDAAVESTVQGAFWAAGQNCLGVQRVFVEDRVFDQFAAAFARRTKQYRVGDKLSDTTDMGPMITEQEAMRVESWVNEALEGGATLWSGGERDRAFYAPTVLTDVPTRCTLACDEVFGPVVSLYRVADLDAAIRAANDAEYGLQAGIFTNDIQKAFDAIHRLDVGGVMVNDSSDYRIDAMPFGGVKNSGLGREGVSFAIQEMTETKVVCFKLRT